jgi:rhodanese-related sulfurtransferase
MSNPKRKQLVPLMASDFRKPVSDLTPHESYVLILNNSNNHDFIVLDVRTFQEYAVGHIKGAINLNYHSRTFIEDLKRLDRNKSYLLYCKVGVRSEYASQIMKSLGFCQVYNMLDGIKGWHREGLPIVK